jgi:putative glutathione S-transferase
MAAARTSSLARPAIAPGSRPSDSAFRRWVSAESDADLPAAPGRYHLYVSHACPWAHRTIIVRALKGLDSAVSLSAVEPVRHKGGWAFGPKSSETFDPVNGFQHLSEAYRATDAAYSGRFNVPVLWDRETSRIVNNESSEIIRMLNSEFDQWGDASTDLYPDELRTEIDEINELVYANVNSGVYRCGFARSQAAYDVGFKHLFETLDWLDARLEHTCWLVGDQPTLADWRLFPTLVRFDAVYFGLFKCNKKQMIAYPNLSRYIRELLAIPGVAKTLRLDEIKRHYYLSGEGFNPVAIVPGGPVPDFEAP